MPLTFAGLCPAPAKGAVAPLESHSTLPLASSLTLSKTDSLLSHNCTIINYELCTRTDQSLSSFTINSSSMHVPLGTCVPGSIDCVFTTASSLVTEAPLVT